MKYQATIQGAGFDVTATGDTDHKAYSAAMMHNRTFGTANPSSLFLTIRQVYSNGSLITFAGTVARYRALID